MFGPLHFLKRHIRYRSLTLLVGKHVAQLVEALCYVPEGLGFDFSEVTVIFQFTYFCDTHYFT
jgi:hypothetical protein